MINAYPYPDYLQEQVIDNLKKAALNELVTCALYRLLESANPKKLNKKLRNLAHTAHQEDWSHYQILLDCLGRIQPETGSVSMLNSKVILPPRADSSTQLLGQIKAAEQASIGFQQEICALTMEYDYRIFDYSYALLNENIEHNERVRECLREGAL